MPTVRVQEADFDVGRELERLTAGRSDVGALASFTGLVRGSNDGSAVRAAVNQTMAAGDVPVTDGDEVAFFPPVTGG